MRHAIPLLLALLLCGCAADKPVPPTPATIAITNATRNPLAHCTLSYRCGPVSTGSYFKPRVRVTVVDLAPGETRRLVPDAPPQGTVRLWLDYRFNGDSSESVSQLSARVYGDEAGFFPHITFHDNGEITFFDHEATKIRPGD